MQVWVEERRIVLRRFPRLERERLGVSAVQCLILPMLSCAEPGACIRLRCVDMNSSAHPSYWMASVLIASTESPAASIFDANMHISCRDLSNTMKLNQ